MITPTIFVGLGTTGIKVISQISEQLQVLSGSPTFYGVANFIGIETKETTTDHSSFLESRFKIFRFSYSNGDELMREVFSQQTQTKMQQYFELDPRSYEQVKYGNLQKKGAKHQRLIGRLSFDASYRATINQNDSLKNYLQEKKNQITQNLRALITANRGQFENTENDHEIVINGVSINTQGVQVVTVLSAAGGTGAGMIGQFAYLLRSLNFNDRKAYILLPPAQLFDNTHEDDGDEERSRGFNAAAVLEDLIYHSEGRPDANIPNDVIPGASELHEWFTHCFIISPEMEDGNDMSNNENQDNLYRSLCTYAAHVCARLSFNTALDERLTNCQDKFHAVGMKSVEYPYLHITKALIKKYEEKIINQIWLGTRKDWVDNNKLSIYFNHLMDALMQGINDLCKRINKDSEWYLDVLKNSDKRQRILDYLSDNKDRTKAELAKFCLERLAYILYKQLSGLGLRDEKVPASLKNSKVLVEKLKDYLNDSRYLWTFDIEDGLNAIAEDYHSELSLSTILASFMLSEESHYDEFKKRVLHALLSCCYTYEILEDVLSQIEHGIEQSIEFFEKPLIDADPIEFPLEIAGIQYQYLKDQNQFESDIEFLKRYVTIDFSSPIDYLKADHNKSLFTGIEIHDSKNKFDSLDEKESQIIAFCLGEGVSDLCTSAREETKFKKSLTHTAWKFTKTLIHEKIKNVNLLADQLGGPPLMSLKYYDKQAHIGHMEFDSENETNRGTRALFRYSKTKIAVSAIRNYHKIELMHNVINNPAKNDIYEKTRYPYDYERINDHLKQILYRRMIGLILIGCSWDRDDEEYVVIHNVDENMVELIQIKADHLTILDCLQLSRRFNKGHFDTAMQHISFTRQKFREYMKKIRDHEDYFDGAIEERARMIGYEQFPPLIDNDWLNFDHFDENQAFLKHILGL